MKLSSSVAGDDSRAVTLVSGADDHAFARTVAGEAGSFAPRPASALLGRGATLGRYLVLARLGAGGMGVVYAAYDPELDRKVAIKLWHQLAGMATTADLARGRLQREAQALARLAHPNVVAVYDVGTHDDRLFVAMEHVDGCTLTDWLEQERRTTAQIVDVFLAAGRGVAAAHAVGLVHRDIKPDNLMIDRDGRVRVMDFGLARSAGSTETAADLDLRNLSAPGRDLTRTGGLLGTPAYMSPEQFSRQPADARSDQFSFCVALHQALYGEAPFGGDTLLELVQNVVDGRLRPPPRGSAVPPHLRRALLRGLKTDPAERWPSMDALLAALADDPRVRRRRWLAGLGGATAVGAALSLAVFQDREQRCSTGEERWSEVWNDARAGAVRAGLRATGRPHADATADRVIAQLDARGRAWSAMRHDACLATHVRGEQSDNLLDLRMRCLDDRLREVDVLAGQLAVADAEAADRAVTATAGLPPLASCGDADALLAAVPPPADPAVRARVDVLRGRLVEAESMYRLGRYLDGKKLADELVAESEAVGHGPLIGDARRVAGELTALAGDPRAAEAALFAALDASSAARDLEGHARAWMALTRLASVTLRRPEDAARWSRAMNAAVQLLPASSDMRASALANTAIALESNGDYAAAERTFVAARAAMVDVHGPDHPGLASLDSGHGAVLRKLGRSDDARAVLEQALARALRVFGERHPLIAGIRINLANLATDRGDYETARHEMTAALRLREETLGPRHHMVGRTRYNLANIDRLSGDLAAARSGGEEALAIFEAALGPTHDDVATALNFLGAVARSEERYADAEPLFQRSLAISEAALGRDNPDIGAALQNLGELALHRERPDDAEPHFTRVLALYERAYGPQHTDLTYPLLGLSAAALQRDDAATSLALAERALALVDARDDLLEQRTRARYRVAAALLRREPDDPRGRALALAAKADVARLPATGDLATYIDELLAAPNQR